MCLGESPPDLSEHQRKPIIEQGMCNIKEVHSDSNRIAVSEAYDSKPLVSVRSHMKAGLAKTVGCLFTNWREGFKFQTLQPRRLQGTQTSYIIYRHH